MLRLTMVWAPADSAGGVRAAQSAKPRLQVIGRRPPATGGCRAWRGCPRHKNAARRHEKPPQCLRGRRETTFFPGPPQSSNAPERRPILGVHGLSFSFFGMPRFWRGLNFRGTLAGKAQLRCRDDARRRMSKPPVAAAAHRGACRCRTATHVAAAPRHVAAAPHRSARSATPKAGTGWVRFG
jgi:hypothetical protein